MNTEYRWRTDDLVDEPARLEITLFWAGSPSVRKPYADVTIRRVQKFRLRADWQYTYEVRNQAGEVVDSGKVSASPGGLFTVKSVVIPVEGVRLAIRP
jgi:hypothetical protein